MKILKLVCLGSLISVVAHTSHAQTDTPELCSAQSMKETSGCSPQARTALEKKLHLPGSKIKFYQNVSVGDGAAATEIILFQASGSSGALWKVELNGEDCEVNNIEPLG